jgi:hypothetical protein
MSRLVTETTMNLMTSGIRADGSDVPGAGSSYRSGTCRIGWGLKGLMMLLQLRVSAEVPDKGHELPELAF